MKSVKGKGTEFGILIPLSGEDECDDSNHTPVIASGTGRILLVDDDELVLMTTRMVLESLGYEVDALSSAHKAIESLEGKMPLMI